MFAFGPQFHIPHHCMSNPFGMGFAAANPKVNFCLGLAAATSGMPTFSPVFTPTFMPAQTPMFNTALMPNSLFSVPALPTFNTVNTFQYQPQQYDFSNYFKFDHTASTSTQSNFKFNYTSPDTNTSEKVTDSNNSAGKKLSLNSQTYGPEFLAKVKQIANRLNCNYRDLLGLMNSESGINSKAYNPNGGATGLIQIMPNTAKSLGTTTAALKNMTPLQQLDYVEKYLSNAKASAGFSSNAKLSAGDLYALTFLPARAKKETLTHSGENYYEQNTGLDLNKDGKITKSELEQRIKNKYVSDNSFLA